MVIHASNHDHGLADPVLLEKIDRLFACNVGDYIDLPQLVVVGDQSSGKSSVLEGLTRLAFPRDSGLCTRFATQIIFRRTQCESRTITASIIPDSSTDDTNASNLKRWKGKDVQSLDKGSFSVLMAEVHALMGVSRSKDDGFPMFSKHILRVEISGPNEDHLSVIDVPGIFRNATPGITTKEDKKLVRDMVQAYMRNPRSIMLIVVPANIDIATQEIVEMARELDPHGERTLGVLTKPDLVDKGAESKVMKLGWVIVRNLGQGELHGADVDRDAAEEQEHAKYPWNTVGCDNFGINALKIRLQEIVTTNARRAFPAVRSEISKELKARQVALRSLGPERKTTEQQMQYLLDIVASFQNLTAHALNANYSSADAFESHPNLRLATRIVNRDAKFSEDLSRWGHTFNFKKTSPLQIGWSDDNGEKQKSGMSQLQSRKLKDVLGIQEILPEASKVPYPLSHDICSWIEDEYRESRGFEIGTFNYVVLSILMKKQSLKWTSLANGYISDIITIVHEFIVKGLSQICTDRKVSESLLSFLMDKLLERYQNAIKHADFLLSVERLMIPMTQNHYLNDTLEKCRQERTKSILLKKAYDSPDGKVIRVDDLKHQQNMSNAEHTVQELRDILESYYKVARKRFVDNICTQAAAYFLVHGPKTPMTLLSPSLVSSLSREQLDEIAGEELTLRKKREKLIKEIDDLTMARKMLL
ncbi:P-loop containing nucleoside triphosphate hydrolase protein [Aspergillus violaceofuscus CBS 115571]|uniref:P-loop containing nucleoside triphosphate hydrolase protein n=1 Tax=Aspergillus violaceofuscus (strain CBS 115571) TaxID=1450538 RepID=A0A2V5H6W6_ASPV1|nr:P-loop containing nucleoside triphosphate hydrolase protein [Aspergillus violaceofuscus CBS 115571]